VFVDGCFWHGCRIHYTEPATNVRFWRRKLARNQGRDRRVDEDLAQMGWRAIRIWEHEVTEDVQAVVRRLRGVVSIHVGRRSRLT